MAINNDEDELGLSMSTLSALAEFYNERDEKEKQFEGLKTQAEDDFATKQWSMEAFTEDWNASQFWYTDATATTLARSLLEGATAATRIAVVSAPSVFIQLKNILPTIPEASRPRITLLEYDTRFNVFPEFIPYDFAQPLKLDGSLKAAFDRIISDPPFLSEDCQTKTALTVQWLAKPGTDTRLVVCTGERMAELVLRLYRRFEVKTTGFRPAHAKGLGNEFWCFANFGDAAWGG